MNGYSIGIGIGIRRAGNPATGDNVLFPDIKSCLLLEDGSRLLLEDGSRLLLEEE